VVAHFHFVMVGAVMIAFLAGLFYWWPKMTGRMYDERLGVASAILVFLGFNVTFIPQFMAGTLGMPRRYATYAEQFQGMNRVSTVGAVMLAAGLVVALWAFVKSLRSGAPAPANPWGGATLEWATSSPPPHDNFAVAPRGSPPYDYTGLRRESDEAGWVPVGEEGAR